MMQLMISLRISFHLASSKSVKMSAWGSFARSVKSKDTWRFSSTLLSLYTRANSCRVLIKKALFRPACQPCVSCMEMLHLHRILQPMYVRSALGNCCMSMSYPFFACPLKKLSSDLVQQQKPHLGDPCHDTMLLPSVPASHLMSTWP